jgi:transposase InsO family protein
MTCGNAHSGRRQAVAGQWIVEAGATPSVGSVGDSYDNALAESINGLYKTEIINRKGPWRTRDGVAPAAAEAMVEQVRVWNRDRRGGAGPDFAVWLKDAPDEALPQGLIIDKRYNSVTISWSAATIAASGQGNPACKEIDHGSRRYDADRRRRQRVPTQPACDRGQPPPRQDVMRHQRQLWQYHLRERLHQPGGEPLLMVLPSSGV